MSSPTPADTQTAVSETHSGTIRRLETGDLPAVAQLFQRTFLSANKPAPMALESYLGELFLGHPWLSDDISSRVFVTGHDELKGFVGVFPLRLQHRGRSLRGAVIGSLMVDKPEADPLIGARLLRSALQAGQDVSISETANAISRKMWDALGATILPTYSLNWTRLLRPAALPFSFASASVARVCAALVSPLDALMSKVRNNPLSLASLPKPTVRGEAVTVDEFIAACDTLATRYALRPEWDDAILSWQLRHAAVKKAGDLQCRLLRKGGHPIGGYLYYGRRGGNALVLQMFALPKHEFTVVTSLMQHAADDGCAAIRGRVQPEFLDALMRHQAVLFHRSSTVVHTKDKDLITTVRLGEAMLTGLAAEAWTRLIGFAFC